MNPIEVEERIDQVKESFCDTIRRRLRERELSAGVRIATRYIHTHLCDEELRVEKVLDECGIHDNSFSTEFRDQVGFTIGRYIRSLRLELAGRLLSGEKLPVLTVADALGYPYRTFVRLFVNEKGCTPKEYQGKNCR